MKFATTGKSFTDALNEKKKQQDTSNFQKGLNVAGDFFSGAKNGGGIKGGLSSAGAAVGDFAAGIGSSHRKYRDDDFTESQKQVQGAIRQVIATMGGPIGPAIAAATGVVDAIGSMTGTNLSNIDKNAHIGGKNRPRIILIYPIAKIGPIKK